jgi:tetratricopeptide (TPR) repeat protein
LEDSHRVSLLEPDLYHADGQILDEVYVYGSFLQSRMYAAGVTCTDCHDPHSTRPVAPGNTLCARCHDPTVFDRPSHHHHPIGSTGSRCAECHMRSRNYMVVDPRRDHSFRVPRPDLTAKIGTPNACNDCHRDRTTEWAITSVQDWFGSQRADTPHYGEALHAAREGHAGADTLLLRVFNDPESPGIVRASTLKELRRYGGPRTTAAIARGARDDDPLVRRTSAEMLLWVDPDSRVRVGVPLLRDLIFTVRIEATAALAALSSRRSPDQRVLLQRGIAELRAALQNNADRSDALVNHGNLELHLGRAHAAEAAFRRALLQNPLYLPAYVNFADLLRMQQRDDEGEQLLLQALDVVPDNAEVHHAMGLLLVRTQRTEQAFGHLARAAELRPSNARFAYVHAVALFDSGAKERSLVVLEDAHTRHPSDRDLLAALVHYNRELGRRDAVQHWERTLRALATSDAGAPKTR